MAPEQYKIKQCKADLLHPVAAEAEVWLYGNHVKKVHQVHHVVERQPRIDPGDRVQIGSEGPAQGNE